MITSMKNPKFKEETNHLPHDASLQMLLMPEEKESAIYKMAFAGEEMSRNSIKDLRARDLERLFSVVILRRYVGKTLDRDNTLVGLVYQELIDRCIECNIDLNP